MENLIDRQSDQPQEEIQEVPASQPEVTPPVVIENGVVSITDQSGVYTYPPGEDPPKDPRRYH